MQRISTFKRVDLLLQSLQVKRIGQFFRRWLIFTTSKHLTNQSVQNAIRFESSKWETKIRNAKESALRIVEQSRAKTREKIEIVTRKNLKTTKTHRQYVSILILDSMMRLSRLRSLSSKFRKWYLLSLNLSLYEKLTNDVEKVRERVVENISERVRLERENVISEFNERNQREKQLTINTERKRTSLCLIEFFTRRKVTQRLKFAFTTWIHHIQINKTIEFTKTRVANRVRIMFALTRLESMLRLRTFFYFFVLLSHPLIPSIFF